MSNPKPTGIKPPNVKAIATRAERAKPRPAGLSARERAAEARRLAADQKRLRTSLAKSMDVAALERFAREREKSNLKRAKAAHRRPIAFGQLPPIDPANIASFAADHVVFAVGVVRPCRAPGIGHRCNHGADLQIWSRRAAHRESVCGEPPGACAAPPQPKVDSADIIASQDGRADHSASHGEWIVSMSKDGGSSLRFGRGCCVADHAGFGKALPSH